MSRCDRDTLWRQGAPAQPGAGAGAQKKTTHFNLIVPPADATDRYEELRAAVLRGELAACFGLGILRRQGLAAWIRALGQRRHAEMAYCDHPTTPAITVDPLPAAGDLTRLIAGIIIAIAMEPAHG
ncbi:hypothetical protein GCM10007857_90550 [Bradyrhizobium iriomotense]|uniref:Uncharacterized protein n=2 Tax=Bradyrhizobium TaxID=374 RepID=A0ABQ6BFU7_9BRAD|nr:hypothetical protein GCM10007857_90550 [Bradyrhizobium iriomotense]